MESIKIGLDLDIGDLKQTTRDLKSEFKSLMESASNKNVSTQFNSMALAIEKTIQKANSLQNRLAKMTDITVPTQEYKELGQQYESLSAKLGELEKQQQLYAASGSELPEKLAAELTRVRDELTQTAVTMTELERTGQSVEYSQPYKDLLSSLNLTNQQLDIQMEKFYQVGNSEGAFAKNTSRVSSAVSKLGNAFKRATSAALEYSKAVTKLAMTKIRDFFKGGSRGVDDMSKSFKRGLTKIFAYGFGIRSLFRLFNKLRGYAKDALGIMAQQFDDVNRDLSILASKFSQFKNSFGTMVQPIIHALIPALLTLMNVLTAVMTKIGEFFAVLTGQKYIYKATEANIDYAKSLEDSTKATKKNTEEIKKNQQQLGYYDKLNVIGQDDNGKTPDYSGIGDDVAGNVQSGFEKVDPTKAVSEFAKKIKEAWKNADFTEVGNIIGKKLQNALENIPWEDIKKNAGKVGKSLATLINGFVETNMDGVSLGSTIGKSIGEGINTAITGLNAFVKNLHWDSVGKFITDGINTAIKTIDWKMLGETIGLGFTGILTILSGFFNDTDWRELGKSLTTGIKEFIKNTDFSKISSTVVGVITAIPELISGALETINWDTAVADMTKAIQEFLDGIDWKKISFDAGELLGVLLRGIINVIYDLGVALGKKTEEFAQRFKPIGNSVALGILKGIALTLLDIGTWLYKNVVKPFVNGFKKGFGIHSPSTVMQPIGKNIMLGVLSGIKLAWKSVKSFVAKIPGKIKNAFVNLPSNLETIFSNAFNRIKLVFSLSNVKTFFTAVVDGIKSVFVGKSGKGGIIKFLKDAFSDAWKGIKEVFSKGGELFEGIKNGVADTFTSIVKSLLKGINSVISVPFKKINDLLEDLKDVKIDLPKPMKDIKPFGFIKTIPVPQIDIPGLATGAVIPPNKQFLAMLGDQKQGVNIETPLDTMIEAFRTALGEQGGTANQGDIVVQINGREIARAVRDENSKQYKQSGAFMPRYSS